MPLPFSTPPAVSVASRGSAGSGSVQPPEHGSMVGVVLSGIGLEIRDKLHPPPPEDDRLPSQRTAPAPAPALPVLEQAAAERPGELGTC